MAKSEKLTELYADICGGTATVQLLTGNLYGPEELAELTAWAGEPNTGLFLTCTFVLPPWGTDIKELSAASKVGLQYRFHRTEAERLAFAKDFVERMFSHIRAACLPASPPRDGCRIIRLSKDEPKNVTQGLALGVAIGMLLAIRDLESGSRPLPVIEQWHDLPEEATGHNNLITQVINRCYGMFGYVPKDDAT